MAASAFAVESANIVGYYDKACPASEFTWACPTFTGIGGQAVSFTLGDLVPNSNFVAFDDNIQFADSEGNWEDALTYCTAADIASWEMVADAGWYALDDDELTDCKNDDVVPFAKGFCAFTSYDNVAIRFCGEVPTNDTPVACAAGEFTWMGNASVANLTLGDIVPNANFVAFDDNIQFADSEGNWEDALTYCTAADIASWEMVADAGWYALDDDELTDCKNDDQVPAGKSFCAFTSYDNVAITIPTPMP